jgi:hypothetical protein
MPGKDGKTAPMSSSSGNGNGNGDNNIMARIGRELAVARMEREERLRVSGKAPQGDTGSPPKHTLTSAYDLNYPKPLTKKVFEASGGSLERTK